MAVVDEINVMAVGAVSPNPDAVRNAIAEQFWSWFEQHANDKVTTVRIWFFSRTLRVRDLKSIFVLLFGAPL